MTSETKSWDKLREEERKALKQAFKMVWRQFKSTKRAHRIPQYMYVAEFFFVSGVKFGLTWGKEETKKLLLQTGEEAGKDDL